MSVLSTIPHLNRLAFPEFKPGQPTISATRMNNWRRYSTRPFTAGAGLGVITNERGTCYSMRRQPRGRLQVVDQRARITGYTSDSKAFTGYLIDTSGNDTGDEINVYAFTIPLGSPLEQCSPYLVQPTGEPTVEPIPVVKRLRWNAVEETTESVWYVDDILQMTCTPEGGLLTGDPVMRTIGDLAALLRTRPDAFNVIKRAVAELGVSNG